MSGVYKVHIIEVSFEIVSDKKTLTKGNHFMHIFYSHLRGQRRTSIIKFWIMSLFKSP